jgi:integrase
VRGLSAATARKARTVLSAVLSYAVAMEYVESNAAMRVPPETDATERVAPTLEETASILLEAEVSDPGETLALRWSGVDFDAGTVSIEGTVSIGNDGAQLRSRTKTKKSRKVALSSLTLDHLREHKARFKSLLEEPGATRHPRRHEPSSSLLLRASRDVVAALPAHSDRSAERPGSAPGRGTPVQRPSSHGAGRQRGFAPSPITERWLRHAARLPPCLVAVGSVCGPGR